MNINSRLQKLERLDAGNRLDLFKHKLVRLYEGQVAGQLDLRFYARDCSAGMLIVELDNEVDIAIIVNSICVYSATAKQVNLQLNLFDTNDLGINLSSSCFCKISIIGEVQFSNFYPHLVHLDNTLIGYIDNKYYVNDTNALVLGDYNIYNNVQTLSKVFDFTCINLGGNELNLYTYFDTNKIVVHNLDSGVDIQIATTQPLDLAIIKANSTYDFYVCALFKKSIKFYGIVNGVAINEYEIDTFGITKISSIVGVTSQSFMCIKSGVVCVATADTNDLKIVFKQLAIGSDIQMYEQSNNLYLISLSEYVAVFKIFSAVDYSLSVSKKYNNISGAFVKSNKLYVISNGLLQVAYE